MKEKPNYWAILHAEVRYDKRLTADEKLLFAEITSLTNATGECWATNEYFGNLYNCHFRTIRRRIDNLEKYGYIEREYTYKGNTKYIEKRVIKLTNSSRTILSQQWDSSVKTSGTVLSNRGDNSSPHNKKNSNNNIKENIFITPLGDLENVLLTEKELEKLQTNYPNHYQDYIDRLSRYVASSGKKYKSHYATILNWIDRDKKKGELKEHVESRQVSEIF